MPSVPCITSEYNRIETIETMFRPVATIGCPGRREIQRRQEQSPDLSELCQGVGVIEGRSVFVISEEGVDAKIPTPVIVDRTKKYGQRSSRILNNVSKRKGGLVKEPKPATTKKDTRRVTAPTSPPTVSSRPAYITWRFLDTDEKQAIIGNSLTAVDRKYLQDYFNFQKKGYYLPPLHQQPWPSEGFPQRAVRAHKTYTTRKGALLLYAEDLAHSFPSKRKKKRKKSLEAEDGPSLNTMNELRSAILSYGAKQQDNKVFMGFPNAKLSRFDASRSVRPGFSAKRYLANWSKSWDDSILNYLRTEGHLLDKTIFQGSPVVPMYRRINDDISDIPKPYTVNREMLVSGGQDRVAYEFYRIRPDDMEYVAWMETDEDLKAIVWSGESTDVTLQPHPPTRASADSSRLGQSGMIATIARDADQVPHPVVYSRLHPEDQQRVLKKLILQSAVHHSPEGGMPDDMEEAIVNLVTENSKSILSGGTAFVMEDTVVEDRNADSTLSGNSWPDGIQTSMCVQVAPQLSSVPTLPPITIQGQHTVEPRAEHPLSSGKSNITLPEINQGQPLVRQSPTYSSWKSMDKDGGEQPVVSLAMEGRVESGLNEQGVEDGQHHSEGTRSRHEKAASVKSFLSLEEKDGQPPITNQLSGSLEDISAANELQDAMRGGVVPKNRTESMRSYKGGSIGSRASSSTTSEGAVEVDLSVVGSVISLPSGDRDEAHVEDENQGPTEDDHTKGVHQGDGDPAPQETKTPPPSLENTFLGSSMLPGDQIVGHMTTDGDTTGTDDSTDNTLREEQVPLSPVDPETSGTEGAQPVLSESEVPIQDTIHTTGIFLDAKVANGDHTAAVSHDTEGDGSPKEHQAPSTAGDDDGANLPSADTEIADASQPTTGDTTNGPITDGQHPVTDIGVGDGKKETLPSDEESIDPVPVGASGDPSYGSSAAKDSADAIPAEDGDCEVNSQPLPTAQIGSDLTEEAVRRHSEDFPKPKKRLSMSSRTSSPQSLRSVTDEGEGSLTASELFKNFSYARRKDSEQGSSRSRKASLQSSLASDRDEAEMGDLGVASATSWADDEMTDQGESGLQRASAGSLIEPLTETDAEESGEEGGTDSRALREQSDDAGSNVIDKMSRNSSSGALSLMSQLEEEAAAIAETVVLGTRPRSGRDLAEDAQLAVALWKELLGELSQNREPPDETQSLILRHRRNSLDGSSVASLDLGQWETPETRKSQRSRQHRRVTSAEAKVDIPDRVTTAGAGDAQPHRSALAPPLQGVEDTNPPVVPAGDDGGQISPTAAQGENVLVPQETPPIAEAEILKLDGVENTLDQQRKEMENAEDIYLQKIIADAGLLPEDSGPAIVSTNWSKVGRKSSKSEKSDQSSSKKSSIKSDRPDMDKVKEFVVGLPHDDKVDYLADAKLVDPATVMKIGTEPPKAKTIVPKPPKKPKKEKAKKRKSKKPPVKPAALEEEMDDKPEEPTLEQSAETAAETNLDGSEVVQDGEEDGENKSGDTESPEFIIIHEEFSDSEPEIQPQQSATEDEFLSSSLLDSQDEGPSMSDYATEDTEDTSSQGPGSLSRSQARAARRAAESERRWREVERKRQAKEEARRRAQEEQERKDRIKMEFEEERRRTEEEARLRLEASEEARRRAEESEQERRRQEELTAERERKQQEDYKRKLDALAKKKKEEEKQRMELEAQRRMEEAEREREEAERVAQMAEEERLEYERQQREEALIAQIRAEEDRMRREVEAQLAQEEARRLAVEIARRQREVERRLRFNRELHSEANVLSHSQEISRAFTWSYFELLDYLGIPIPENLKEKYLKGQLLTTATKNDHSAESAGH